MINTLKTKYKISIHAKIQVLNVKTALKQILFRK